MIDCAQSQHYGGFYMGMLGLRVYNAAQDLPVPHLSL